MPRRNGLSALQTHFYEQMFVSSTVSLISMYMDCVSKRKNHHATLKIQKFAQFCSPGIQGGTFASSGKIKIMISTDKWLHTCTYLPTARTFFTHDACTWYRRSGTHMCTCNMHIPRYFLTKTHRCAWSDCRVRQVVKRYPLRDQFRWTWSLRGYKYIHTYESVHLIYSIFLHTS